MTLQNELDNYAKVPTYMHRVAKKMIKMIEGEKVQQFLMELNYEIFSTIESQILNSDKLPSLDKIFNMVKQEENHKNDMMTQDQRREVAVAFAIT